MEKLFVSWDILHFSEVATLRATLRISYHSFKSFLHHKAVRKHIAMNPHFV